MRKEKFDVDNYVHIYNRGNRKVDIVRSDADKWRFMQALRFFNDSHSAQNLLRQISLSVPGTDRQIESVFETGWPLNWPEKDPLVKILCYCLVSNHFHLLLKEIRQRGISKFMHKLGLGYTNFFNLKYREVGRVFQGPYKVKVIEDQRYLEYLCAYIQVKNVLELFPGGLEAATKNPEEATRFVDNYSFSSHQDYAGLRESLIIDKDVLGEIFPTPGEYKKFVYGLILAKDFWGGLDDLKLE
ncbi:MAG: transposase [Candidatus Parcubacteria bacterium]|nr:transposase [Candidatus Parcubacteria bacterium]